jgi:hypothetical protein
MARDRWIFEGVDKERRARIIDAVRHGRALPDPADARVAVAYARTLIRPEKRFRRALHVLSAGSVFAFLVVEFVLSLRRRGSYELPSPATVFLFFYLSGHAVGAIWGRKVKQNARVAERLNLEMAAAGGHSSRAEDYDQPPDSEKQPARYPPFREMWPLHVLLGVTLVGIVLLRTLPSHSRAMTVIALLTLATAFATVVFAYRSRKSS